jgi:thioredoxin-related protein
VSPDALGAGPGEVLWAHHAALVAIPAFVPAIVVVGVVLYIARKDRQDEANERDLIERAFEPEPDDTPDDGEQGRRP